jgi:SAM-dependent methyltransferase
MNSETYAVEAQVQRTHWWFDGRRRLLARLLRNLGPRPAWRVLEVGAGTGANLPVLGSLGVRQVVACDLSLEALRYSAAGSRAVLARADASCLPFRVATFDLLVAADVIEHLDDDAAALAEFVRVLKPGGHLVLTVPSFPSLWGPQDIVAHHRRRYVRTALLGQLRRSGLHVDACFHFNYLLFVPIWAARKLLLAMRVRVNSENEINTDWMNRVLRRVFFIDVDTAPRVRAPFGVSLCLVAMKPIEG